MPKSRKCSICNVVKVLEKDFYKQSPNRNTHGNGYLKQCKACVLERNRKSSQKNKKKIRENKLIYRYGITVEDYEQLLNSQNSCCAICQTKNPSSKRKAVRYFCVDHCHATGKVRGLLCSTCNTALGLFEDSQKNLIEAVNYLNRFEALL
jgi:hypothetical protein